MKPLWQRLNELSHTFGYDTTNARLCGEAALRIQALETALAGLLEHQGHVALNTVGDVRKQCKLMKAREIAQNVLEEK